MNFSDMNGCAHKYLAARQQGNDGEAENFLGRLYEMVFREDFCKCVIAHIHGKNDEGAVIQNGSVDTDAEGAPGYFLFERAPYCYYQGILSDAVDRSLRKIKSYEGPAEDFNFVGLFEKMAENAKKDEFLSGKLKAEEQDDFSTDKLKIGENIKSLSENPSNERSNVNENVPGKKNGNTKYVPAESSLYSLFEKAERNGMNPENELYKEMEKNPDNHLLHQQISEPESTAVEKAGRAEVFDKLSELGHQIVRLHLLKGKENNPERQHYYRLFYTEQLNECLDIIKDSSDEKELRSDAKRSGGIFRHENEILQEIIWTAFLKYYTQEGYSCASFIEIMKAVRKTYGETCGDISARADREVQFPFPHSLYRYYLERIEHKQTSDANISKMSRNYSGYLEKFRENLEKSETLL